MLILGADRALRLPLRLVLTTIQLVALVPFGGRTSLTLAVVVVCLAALKPIGEAVGGRRFDLRAAIAAALVVPLAAAAAAAAWFGGALAPLIERFSADRGSAEARVVVFDLFDAFSLQDILLGPIRSGWRHCRPRSASNTASRTVGSGSSSNTAR